MKMVVDKEGIRHIEYLGGGVKWELKSGKEIQLWPFVAAGLFILALVLGAK